VSAFGKTVGGFFQAPTLALELEQMTVVHEPIEQRGDDHDVAEHGRKPSNSNE
jgi:hypothetical protein